MMTSRFRPSLPTMFSISMRKGPTLLLCLKFHRESEAYFSHCLTKPGRCLPTDALVRCAMSGYQRPFPLDQVPLSSQALEHGNTNDPDRFCQIDSAAMSRGRLAASRPPRSFRRLTVIRAPHRLVWPGCSIEVDSDA